MAWCLIFFLLGTCDATCYDTNGGNAGGACSQLPFNYKKKVFTSCTSYDVKSGRSWCATTSGYDKNERWGYCPNHSKVLIRIQRILMYDQRKFSLSISHEACFILFIWVYIHITLPYPNLDTWVLFGMKKKTNFVFSNNFFFFDFCWNFFILYIGDLYA